MRVITGTARGRKLQTLEGIDVRPTSDMVKEAVFSIIQFQVPGATVLDLFAGSGQMGIEALSRGAKRCVFIDAARASIEVVKKNLDATGFFPLARVVNMDALAFLATTKDTFDIVFLDPPYHKGLLQQVLPQAAVKTAPDGIILCEHAMDEELPEMAGEFCKYKTYKYGKIRITSYRKPETEEDDE